MLGLHSFLEYPVYWKQIQDILLFTSTFLPGSDETTVFVNEDRFMIELSNSIVLILFY